MIKKEYDTIEYLKGLDGIRKNPSMYLGSIENSDALYHMLGEIIDNAVDEFMNGHGKKIIVTLYNDDSVSVEDWGRGIPVRYVKEEKMSSLELAMTKLHSGGKFKSDKSSYIYSGGLHGVGLSSCTALSDKLKVIVWRDGKEYSMTFAKGKKTSELTETPGKPNRTGTFVRFVPDPTIFKNITTFDEKIIKSRLHDLSFLCKDLSVQFVNEKTKTREECGGAGLPEFIKHLSKGKKLIDSPIVFEDSKDKIIVNVALQWLEESSEEEVCKYFTNNIPNTDGGTHMIGFKSGLTRTINNYIANADLPKTFKISLSGDDVREGLIGVVSIKHPDPKFNSQDKVKLVSDDARAIVESIVSEQLMSYLDKNPITAKKIITNCVNAFKAREAARKAREAIRKTSLDGGVGVLPGKLADCSSKNPDECELFICEGNSAGGSMKMGRSRETQAILPLRGKILNIEKSDYQKLIKNEELMNIITAIGIGIGKNIDMENLRYNKIIIATDADVDGSHIRALLLTFFYRQMPQLILKGHIYIAQPPLYRVDYRGNFYYLKNEKELNDFILEKKIVRSNLKLQRFKGLGEMNPPQLWETTMDPEKRTLIKIFIDNPLEVDKVFSILMGDQVEPRKDFITSSAQFAKLDI